MVIYSNIRKTPALYTNPYVSGYLGIIQFKWVHLR